MDKLSAMRAFVRVVECASFTRAAETLGWPKPTVSRWVQWLEGEVKIVLLKRTARGVTVTPGGAAYFERASRILAEVDDLEAGLSSERAAPSGHLRVDVGSAMAQTILVPALPDFFARYPGIDLKLGVSDRPVDLVSENIDCVLRTGDLRDESLVARRLGQFRWLVCASPEYLKQHGVPAHPKDLEGGAHRVVGYFFHRTGRVYPFVLSKDGERVEVECPPSFATNDIMATLEAGVRGLGIIRTTTATAHQHLKSGTLQPVLADWSTEAVPFYVVYPSHRHLNARLRVFIDWVAELFAPYDSSANQDEA
ncbi:MAG TPA: LysR family transcriptional regulator [Albitalea sp.]|uniref:LysR substrate-binding domain-containing protein n=1 Tax=Piscinibacter sp. TaxID=1903157 RepID=UPI002ED498CC